MNIYERLWRGWPYLSFQCPRYSGQPWEVQGGDLARGASSQLPSRPGLHIDYHNDDDHNDIDDHDDDDHDDSYLFLPDALKELQHGEGRVGGAIIRPACELEL